MQKLRTFILLNLLLAAICSCSPSDNPVSGNTAQTVKIAIADDPTSLDPRLARTLIDASLIYSLYEGLLHFDFNGHPKPAIARKVELDDAKTTYTFHLKQTNWSNGDPLTAHDFAETWRSLLEKGFPSPNAFQLFPIRNAERIKNGELPSSELGVETPSDYTLVVHLEYPLPYFEKLVASFFSYPVHSSVRKGASPETVTNGSYTLSSWVHKDHLSLQRSPSYFDNHGQRSLQVDLVVVGDTPALQLFRQRELDWAGSPLSTLPIDALQTLKAEGILHTKPSSGVHWIRVNTSKEPLKNRSFRQALNMSIDRKSIVDYILKGNQKPAFGIIPNQVLAVPNKDFINTSEQEMEQRFQRALSDLKRPVEELPKLTLCYGNHMEINHKVAQSVQQQWKQDLKIDVVLDPCEQKLLNQKLRTQDYDLALGSWYADIEDPTNFLSVFQSRQSGLNNTGWEDPEYKRLLQLADRTAKPEERKALLTNAEEILIFNSPVLPLWFGAFNYVKNDQLRGVYFSSLGYLDFRYAYLDSFPLEEPR